MIVTVRHPYPILFVAGRASTLATDQSLWSSAIERFTDPLQEGAQLQPCLPFRLEGEGVGRAARGQGDEREALLAGQLLHPERRRLAAVEADRAQGGEAGRQLVKRVRLMVANRAIEAAAAGRRADRVPEADSGVEQGAQPLLIRKRDQVRLHHSADQPPEMVARIAVILPPRE